MGVGSCGCERVLNTYVYVPRTSSYEVLCTSTCLYYVHVRTVSRTVHTTSEAVSNILVC